MSCKFKKGESRGVSLISLVIVIIILIILALVFIGTGSTMPDEATYAKFVQEINSIQIGVLDTRLKNSQYGDSEEKVNLGFTKVTLINAPEGFESFDYTGNTMTGYIVSLKTIGYENAEFGQKYDSGKVELEFDKDDVYVYDATGAVYYVKGLEYDGGKVYSIANITASGLTSSQDGPIITNIVVTSGELDNGTKTSAKAKIIVSALPRYNGNLTVMVRTNVAEAQPDGTYATQVTRNGVYTIIVTEENGGRTVTKVNVTGIIENVEPPQNLSMTINDNGGFTQVSDVDVTVRADGASKMLISKNNPLRPSSIDPKWQEYKENFQYNLGTQEGTVTLYAWFIDDFGNISDEIVKASTVFDKTAPSTVAPTLTVTGPYVIVSSNQTDNISSKEYLNSAMRYGYRISSSDPINEDSFSWVTTKLISGLANRNNYDFVTMATDQAGNKSISAKEIATIDYDITIKFDVNGGTGTFEDIFTKESVGIALPTEIPSKLGYTFVGWSEDINAEADSADIRKAGEVYTPAGSEPQKILYAIWEANPDTPYKVYHYVENVNVTGEYELVLTEDLKGVTGKEVFALAKTEGEFLGLIENTTHPERLTMTTLMPDGSTELKIFYDRVRYTLTLKAVNGSVSPTTSQVIYGAEVHITATGNSGYHFHKWSIEGAGDDDENYDNFINELGKESQNAVFKMPNKNITLVANYRAEVYTITYKLNGGVVSSENPAEYSKESGVFTLVNPIKVGYEFAGWVGTDLSVPTIDVTIDPLNLVTLGNRNYEATYVAAENLLQISATPEVPTKDNVIVSMTCLDKDLSVEYRIGNAGGWTKYTKTIEISENCTVYARALLNGTVVTEKTLVISNIDEENPVIGDITISDNWQKGESLKVHVEVTDNIGLESYAISTGNVQPNAADFIELTADKDVILTESGVNYIWIKDKAGNTASVMVNAYDISKNSDKMLYAFFKNNDADMIITGNGETKSYVAAEVLYRNIKNKVKTIEIQNGVITIGDNIISSMENVDKISIPVSLDLITEDAMIYTNNFTDIKVASGNQSFVYSGFTLYNNDKTTIYVHSRKDERNTYEIEDTVKTIRKLAFYDNDKLNKIITTSNPNLDAQAFEDCSNLLEINGQIGGTEIGDKVFANCSALETLVLSSGLINIGNSAFEGTTHLASLTVPKTVKTLGDSIASKNGVFKNIGISAGNPTGKGIVRYYQSSAIMVKYADIYSSEATFVLIDDMAAYLKELRIENPVSGTYPVGTEITFVAEFNELLDDSKTPPTLTIKIGNGMSKEVTNVRFNGATIIYTYTAEVGDEGELKVASLAGTVYDMPGNVTNVNVDSAVGSNIVIDTYVKLEENTTIKYFVKLQDAINEARNNPESVSKITLLKDVTENVIINKSKVIELNLNSKSIEAANNTSLIKNNADIKIIGAGNLAGKEGTVIENMTDSTVAISNVSISSTSTTNPVIVNNSSANLDMNTVTITAQNTVVNNTGKMIIVSSNITSSAGNIIRNYANSTSVVTSSLLTLNATDKLTYAVNIQNTAVSSFENTTINAVSAYGINNDGVLDLKGSATTINAIRAITNGGTIRIYDGIYENSDTAVSLIYNVGNLNVHGGNYVSENKNVLENKTGIANIHGGNMNTLGNGETIHNYSGAELNVYGGIIQSTNSSALVNQGVTTVTSTAKITAGGSNNTVVNDIAGKIDINGGLVEKTSSIGSAILNKANLNITNAEIHSSSANVIENSSIGNIDLYGAIITLTTTVEDASAIKTLSSGNLKIENSQITANATSVKTNGVSASAGTVNIQNSTIKATGNNSVGINNTGAKVVIGILDASIATDTPVIEGTKSGYYSNDTGKLEYYDGKFIGAVGFSIDGKITVKPDSTFIKKTVNENVETSIIMADYDKPTNVILTANPNGWTFGNVTFTGTAEDNNSGIIAYAFTKNNVEPANNEWVTLDSALSAVTFTYEVTEKTNMYFYVRDLAENVAVSNVAYAYIDREAPEITAITKNPDTWTKNQVTLTIKAVDELSGICGYEITNTFHEITDTSKYTYIAPANEISQNIITGNGIWYIYLIDQAGNVKYTSYEVKNVDTIAPEILMTLVSYSDANAIIKIEATDNESGVGIIRVNNNELTLKNSATKENTVETNYTITSNGVFNIEAIDNVGNIKNYITEAYYITYNSNSAYAENKLAIKIKDIARKIEANSFVANGFEFNSWNTKSDGSGTNYNPNDEYTDNENLSLYAIWDDIEDPSISLVKASENWVPGNSENVKLTIVAKDNVGVTGYAITKSGVTPTSWSTSPDVDVKLENGVYQAWVKDKADNSANYEFTLYNISSTENPNAVIALYKDGELNIHGNGKIKDYTSGGTPWNSNINEIERIMINPGITYIGDYVLASLFENEGIEGTILIPNTVTEISKTAFVHSMDVSKIAIDNDKFKYSNGIVYDTDGVIYLASKNNTDNNIVIPFEIKEIAPYAFEETTSETITIINNINLPEGAFYNSTSLKNLITENGIGGTTIGKSAFEGCTNLEFVEISEDLQTINEKAFYNATSLTEIYIPATVTKLDGTNIFTNMGKNEPDGKGIVYYYESCDAMKKYATDSITKNQAIFVSLDDISPVVESVIINDGKPGTIPRDIDVYIVASDNHSVKQVYITENPSYRPSNIDIWQVYTPGKANKFTLSEGTGEKTIYVWARDNSDNVSKDSMSATVTLLLDVFEMKGERLVIQYLDTTRKDYYEYRDEGYILKDNKYTINVRNNVNHNQVGDYTYEYDLIEGSELIYTFVRNVKVIDNAWNSSKHTQGNYTYVLNGTGEYAKIVGFTNVDGLSELVLPDYLGNNNEYRVIDVGDGTNSICTQANANYVTSLTLPKYAIAVSDNAFSNFTQLSTLNYSDALMTIGKRAFSDNTDVHDSSDATFGTLTLKSNVREVKEEAFRARGINQLMIEDGVKSIENSVFYETIGSDSEVLNIPASVDYIGTAAFGGRMVNKIIVSAENQKYKDVDQKALLNIDGNNFYLYAGRDATTEYTVPDGVITLTTASFSRALNVQKVTLPDSIRKIEYATFRYDSNLKVIENYENLTYINERAFYNTGLEDFEVPSGVTTVDSSVFAGTKLKDIYLHSGITQIGTNAYSNISTLNSVVFAGKPTIVNNAFSGSTNLKSIIALDKTTVITVNGGDIDIPSDANVYTVSKEMETEYESEAVWGKLGTSRIICIAELVGDQVVELEHDTVYEEKGIYLANEYIATGDGESTKVPELKVVKESDVDMTKIGNYTVTYIIKYREQEILRLTRSIKSYDKKAPTIHGVTTLTSWVPGTNLQLTVDATDDYDTSLSYAVTTNGVYTSATWQDNSTVTLSLGTNHIHVKDDSDNESTIIIKAWDLSEKTDKKVFGYMKLDGELVVTGSGATLDIQANTNKNPWSDDERDVFTKLTFEEGVTTLKNQLFRNMNNVSEIYLSSTVTYVGSNGSNSLMGTNNFDRIAIAEGNTWFKLIDNYTLGNQGNDFLYLHSRKDSTETYNIPSTITVIQPLAFYKNTNVKVINANELKNIYSSTFEYCTNLTTLNGEIGTNILEYRTFANTALKDIYISKKLQQIIGTDIFTNVPGPVWYYASCNAMCEYVNKYPTQTDFRLIDDVKPTTDAPTLKSSSSVIVATSNQIDVHSPVLKSVEYNISTTSGVYDEDKWQDENYFLNLTANTTYYVVTRATDDDDNSSVSEESSIDTKKVPENINITATPTDPTRGNVTVVVEWPEVDIEKLYGAGWPAGTTVVRQLGIKGINSGDIEWQVESAGTSTVIVTENNTTIYARLFDGKNYTAGTKSLTIANIDRIAPTGSITINNNAYETLEQKVTLNLTASDNMSKGVTYYYASEDDTTPIGDLTTEEWKEFKGNGNYEFELTFARGEKEINVWYLDFAGNMSTVYSDTIILQANTAKLEQNSTTTYYDTLKEAIAAAVNTSPAVASRITLLKDITTEGPLYIDSGKNIALDMNGHIINHTANAEVRGIENTGKLRIENTSATSSSITISTTVGKAYGIYNTGLVDVNGVSIYVTAPNGNAVGIHNSEN